MPGAPRLRFCILAFDFRGQGESDAMQGYAPLHWCTEFEVRDVQSVVQFVRSHSALNELSIGLMGVSRGANAALVVAAADDRVECVVADSAFTTDTLMVLYAARWVRYTTPRWFVLPEWHLHISCQLARFVSQLRRSVRHPKLERWLPALRRRSVLLIAGERDSYVPPESSRRIQTRIGGNSTVWFVPGAKHNAARRANSQDYDKRVVDLFLNMVPLHQRPPAVTIADLAPKLQPVD
ncbi:MAG: alpha/beta fold hydrolase [Fuerstiella sp.]